MKKCDSILSMSDLKTFDISTEEIYKKVYEISGSKLSNSCFLHRICWNVLFGYSYQIVGDCICLVADDNKINRAHIVYPLGQFSDLELKKIIQYWREVFNAYNKPLRIEFVDKIGLSRLCRCLDEEGILWHSKKCEDCFDYIYDIEDYINLVGKKNKMKRLFWNRYLHGTNIYRLERVERKNINVCQQITRIWEFQKGLSRNSMINSDHYPLEFLWKHIYEIDNHSYILYRNDIAIAFFVASIYKNYCIFHFAKSDRTYPEANFLLHYLFLNSDDANGIKILNFEEDMGDFNIRRYKSSIAQNKLLEKYSVEVNN